MDNLLTQQINYATLVIGRWSLEGARIWDFREKAQYPSQVILNGMAVSGEELSNYCIASKRRAQYALSIGGYIRLLDTARQENGRIPVDLVRGLFKTLLAANAIDLAFNLVSVILSDMQSVGRGSGLQYNMFFDYFRSVVSAVKGVNNYDDFSALRKICTDFSGNPYYEFVSDKQELRAECQKVCSELQEAYGS